MSMPDPTVLIGDASLAPDKEFSVEDVAAAANGTAAGEPEAPPRIQLDRIYAGPEAPAEPPEGAAGAIAVTPVPILIKRAVSGRYRSTGTTQLELRVDADGRRPTRRCSGDFYVQSGATLAYFGSFTVHAPAITVTTTTVTLDGVGTFTWAAGYPRIRVTIPRTTIFVPAAAATLQFLTLGGSPGASYVCPYASPFFRTVLFEEDYVAGVTPFVSYDTGSLPAPPPARTLSVPGAFAEAGVELRVTGVRNLVPTGSIGTSWSNAELHAAMMANFSLHRNQPQFGVWMLTALLHDLGSGLLGIMFDQEGLQRQGCAVFHAGLGGGSAAKQRDQLFTCVHELGHCFNLYHSFHKQYMNPPQPNRLNALSWMNYPWNFPGGGPAAFWPAFPFQFDDLELIHLRHAFRNQVIMGGNPFGTGAALEHDEGERFAPPVEDNSGLRLELRGRTSYGLGEPVCVEIKLETTDTRGREVNGAVHPNLGFVEVGIRKPGGHVVSYKPPFEHFMAPPTAVLDGRRPALYASAYIGFGKDGLYFDAPGIYQLRAVYLAADGSRVVSDTFSLRVRSPVSREDDEVAELLLGEEQGMLFYVLGSDSPALQNGRGALERLADRHAKHPLATYARLVRGVNEAREFKQVTPAGTIHTRDARPENAVRDLSAVVTAAETVQTLDNITLGQVMSTLAEVQESAGDVEAAAMTAQNKATYLRRRITRPHVLAALEAEAASYQSGDGYVSAAERRARPDNFCQIPVRE